MVLAFDRTLNSTPLPGARKEVNCSSVIPRVARKRFATNVLRKILAKGRCSDPILMFSPSSFRKLKQIRHPGAGVLRLASFTSIFCRMEMLRLRARSASGSALSCLSFHMAPLNGQGLLPSDSKKASPVEVRCDFLFSYKIPCCRYPRARRPLPQAPTPT